MIFEEVERVEGRTWLARFDSTSPFSLVLPSIHLRSKTIYRTIYLIGSGKQLAKLYKVESVFSSISVKF
jgi:hypothetical protein